MRAFARLAMMDGEASGYERELRDLPMRVEALRKDVQLLEVMLQSERTTMEEAAKIKEERLLDLKVKAEALTRAKQKGGQARNLREVDAAEREVEANRRGIKEREEEIATIDATLEEKKKVLAEREAQFLEAKGILDQEEAETAARLKEVTAKRDVMIEGRDELLAAVPSRHRKRYERLRGASKYDAVSIIDADGSCKSCRFKLPPQLFIEVQRAEDFYNCPQCAAYLVHRDIAVGEGRPAEGGDDESKDASDDAAPADDAPSG